MLKRVQLTKRQRAQAATQVLAAAEAAAAEQAEQAAAAAAAGEAVDVSEAARLRAELSARLTGGEDVCADTEGAASLLRYQLYAAVGPGGEETIPPELLTNRALLETFMNAGDCRSTKGYFGGVIWCATRPLLSPSPRRRLKVHPPV